jgi:cobalt-precorrin 5A hydrolase
VSPSDSTPSRTALLVLSEHGLDLARRVRAGLGVEARIFGPSCVVGRCGGPGAVAGNPTGAFESGEDGVLGWTGPLRRFVPAVWEESDAIVAVMALGIVVRLVAPLATDKRNDPAVVAVDEAGRFVIAVLGGHGSGANDLARAIAATIGATAVITTASDARGLPALDLIGRDRGWRIERVANLTRASAAVVRGERVAVFQDSGSPDWWRQFGSWPDHFTTLERLDDWRALDPSALLVISDRVEPDDLPADRTIIYRPRTLLAGVGCKRGTPREVIADWVESTFARHGLAIGSLATVATASLKADEPGLIAFAESRGVPLVHYPAERLEGVPGIERPSERVRAKIGIAAVSEPAALLASGADRLVVPKQIGLGVTVAVARREEAAHHP